MTTSGRRVILAQSEGCLCATHAVNLGRCRSVMQGVFYHLFVSIAFPRRLKFCPISQDLMYPKEDRSTKKLIYYCR